MQPIANIWFWIYFCKIYFWPPGRDPPTARNQVSRRKTLFFWKLSKWRARFILWPWRRRTGNTAGWLCTCLRLFYFYCAGIIFGRPDIREMHRKALGCLSCTFHGDYEAKRSDFRTVYFWQKTLKILLGDKSRKQPWHSVVTGRNCPFVCLIFCADNVK